MSSNDEDKPKVKQYGDALGQIMNHVKNLAQQVQEQSTAARSNSSEQPTKAPSANMPSHLGQNVNTTA